MHPGRYRTWEANVRVDPLALPDRPVTALIGDGSAMYTCQALWTAAYDRIAVVFVTLNNSSYRILKQRTQVLKNHADQTG